MGLNRLEYWINHWLIILTLLVSQEKLEINVILASDKIVENWRTASVLATHDLFQQVLEILTATLTCDIELKAQHLLQRKFWPKNENFELKKPKFWQKNRKSFNKCWAFCFLCQNFSKKKRFSVFLSKFWLFELKIFIFWSKFSL